MYTVVFLSSDCSSRIVHHNLCSINSVHRYICPRHLYMLDFFQLQREGPVPWQYSSRRHGAIGTDRKCCGWCQNYSYMHLEGLDNFFPLFFEVTLPIPIACSPFSVDSEMSSKIQSLRAVNQHWGNFDFSPKVQVKIQNGKPWFKATPLQKTQGLYY